MSDLCVYTLRYSATLIKVMRLPTSIGSSEPRSKQSRQCNKMNCEASLAFRRHDVVQERRAHQVGIKDVLGGVEEFSVDRQDRSCLVR